MSLCNFIPVMSIGFDIVTISHKNILSTKHRITDTLKLKLNKIDVCFPKKIEKCETDHIEIFR